jgi:hypothetical protein
MVAGDKVRVKRQLAYQWPPQSKPHRADYAGEEGWIWKVNRPDACFAESVIVEFGDGTRCTLFVGELERI